MKLHAVRNIAILVLTLCACVIHVPPEELGPNAPVEPGSESAGSNTTGGHTSYRLDGSHWVDVGRLKAKAEGLSLQIAAGRLDKQAAAEELNRFRLSTVGSNKVDDSIADVYLHAAVESKNGRISNAQSKALVKSALLGWQQRWKQMSDAQKPTNPAFTNFLNETMGLPYLK